MYDDLTIEQPNISWSATIRINIRGEGAQKCLVQFHSTHDIARGSSRLVKEISELRKGILFIRVEISREEKPSETKRYTT